MKNFLDFLKNRMSERSTWAGLVALLAAVGLEPFKDGEFAESFIGTGLQVAQAVLGVVGLVLGARKEKASPDAS